MDSKAPCSTACLDAMEDLLGYTTSSNFKCRDYWNTRVTNDVDTCSRECTNLRTQSKPCLGDEAHCYPLGKRALYEGFLGKCQDQRRAIYMAALNTDPVRQPVTEDAWGNYVVEAEAEVVFSSKNSRAFVGVGKVDPAATLDVNGEIMTDRVEALSINGWDADMFRKGIALAAYICGCAKDAVWAEAAPKCLHNASVTDLQTIDACNAAPMDPSAGKAAENLEACSNAAEAGSCVFENGRPIDPAALGCGCNPQGARGCSRDGTCLCAATHEGKRCERWRTSGVGINAGLASAGRRLLSNGN